MRGSCNRFLAANQISKADVARGIDKSRAFVSMLGSGKAGASQATIAAILQFLSGRVGRRVTYEELFAPETRKGAA